MMVPFISVLLFRINIILPLLFLNLTESALGRQCFLICLNLIVLTTAFDMIVEQSDLVFLILVTAHTPIIVIIRAPIALT